MIQYRCECGRTLQADENQAGLRARCPTCGASSTIPASEAVQDTRPARGDDRYDDRPRRRSRDEEPAKGTSVAMILVIVGAVLFGGLVVCGGLALGLLLPAVQKVREAAQRMQEQNNFKQLALAAHNHHDTVNQFPRPAIESKDGKPLLSWRVALLPYVEGENLHQQFKLDEPWDSDHNKRLIPLIPKVYLRPGDEPTPEGLTHYQAVVGKGLLFDPKYRNSQGVLSGRRLTEVTDGTSNTVLFVEAKTPVVWTKPEDIDADDGAPLLPRLGDRFRAGTTVVTADGFVRQVRFSSEATLKAALTAAGGEVGALDR